MDTRSVIEQAGLMVQDLERAIMFYSDILGFNVLEQSGGKASLSADGKTTLLFLIENKHAKPRQPGATGLYHLAFLLPKRSDLANVLNHFIQCQYPMQGASDHHVSEALYLSDPEGNEIEIYCDRSPDEWKWQGDQVVMTTEPLDVGDLLEVATDSGWKGMPESTIIGHVHLSVSELQETKRFYCEALGFDPVLNYGSQALFVSKGGYHHHIGLNTWQSANGQAPSENSVGLKWFGIKLKEEEKQEVIGRLEKVDARITSDAGQIITKDPSGIEIHIL